MLTTSHTEVKHGIFNPFCLETFYGKTLKQFLASLEIAFHS